MRWRDAVVDSDLSSSAKLVGLVLTTWMNGAGVCWPSKSEIAKRSSLSERTIYTATRELEASGLLKVSWSRGNSSHKYAAIVAGSTRQMVPFDLANPALDPATVAAESAESAESPAEQAVAALRRNRQLRETT